MPSMFMFMFMYLTVGISGLINRLRRKENRLSVSSLKCARRVNDVDASKNDWDNTPLGQDPTKQCNPIDHNVCQNPPLIPSFARSVDKQIIAHWRQQRLHNHAGVNMSVLATH
jgi:hypothetical protein